MGLAISYIKQTFPPKSQFSVDDIPDLTGKVVLVTGGNTGKYGPVLVLKSRRTYSGIGYETIRALLQHNAKVYLAARNSEKGKKAVEHLTKEFPGSDVFVLKLDLASLESIEKAAAEFTRCATPCYLIQSSSRARQ